MIVRKILWCLALLMGGSLGIFAGETGKISGKISDSETGEALIGANVVVESRWDGEEIVELDTPSGAASDVDGFFFILNLRPGVYNVRVIYVGYQDQVKQKVRVEVDKTTRLDVQLATQSVEAEEVLVTAYKPLGVEKDVTATKQSYTVDEIQSIAGVTDVTDILSLQADVVGENFRGGREGEALYLVSGSSIVNPLNRSRAFRPITTALQEVEVYTSGFSAEYGNAQSGVVNMVTKEGGNKWNSRMEVSSNLPYYKTWTGTGDDPKAGSIYDAQYLQFYNLLMDLEQWLQPDPIDGNPLYDISYGFGPTYLPPFNVWPPRNLTHQDSLRVARISQILWMQAVRGVGMDYDNRYDTRLDFSTGGPISKKAKLFFATRQNFISPIIPTTQADIDRQFVGNITYQLGVSDKIKFEYIYDRQFRNDIGSAYLRWMFDRTLSIAKENSVSQQFGFSWNHVFSNSTYMDLRMKSLNLLTEQRIELLDDGEFIEDYSNNTNWVDYTAPSNHRVGRPEDDYGDEKVHSFNLDASLSSQINRFNLLKAGLQFSYYDLNVDMKQSLSTPGNFRNLNFRNFPIEGAFFIQDKMEFSGMIANAGMRVDFYDLKTTFFQNPYAPFRDPDAVENVDMKVIVQPRVGVSFPVSENSVFHLNYGTFTQRPSFNQVFYNQVNSSNGIVYLGNPLLEPEKTNSYDFGLVQGITEDVRLDVSAYYKDVTNLIQDAIYKDFQDVSYQTFVNREYADIKGFHISFEKTGGFFNGYVRYNYETATANRPNTLDAPLTFQEAGLDGALFTENLPALGDVYLNFDRTHKAVFNLRFNTNEDDFFSVLGYHPFGRMKFSTTFRYMTGRPYTFDNTGQGLQFNQRTPNEKDWKMRIEKGIVIQKQQFNLYFEAFNLLNQGVFSYSRAFGDKETAEDWNLRNDIFLTEYENDPYNTSRGVYLVANQPRHYRFGMYLRF
ncbi:MAG: TonB-dependent receptor [Calditrichia bacterium]